MIQALMWKEYREHRATWLALACVGGAGLYGLSRLMGPVWGMSYSLANESLQAVAVLFAWTYGLVCGAMLLANENEAGTLTFLDLLPVRRIQLWLAKSLFGLLLLLAQVAVLSGVVVGLGIAETPLQLMAILLAMLFFGLFALFWGLLFSARGQNVLNVIGLAFAGQIAAVVLASLLCVFLLEVLTGNSNLDGQLVKIVLICLFAAVLTVCPAVGSAFLFARLDRERRRRRPRKIKAKTILPAWASWRRLVWLSFMQMRRLLVVLIVLALGLGCALPMMGPAAWPMLTLLLGVLCGVSVWSDEQMSASFRFLGDQRYPLGRVWIVKVGMRLALAVLAAFLLLLPSLLLALTHRPAAPRLMFRPSDQPPFVSALMHSSLVGSIVPIGTHLCMWLLYGFSSGQLCGMLFRKSMVAGVVGLASAAALVCLWLPSLLGIGLHFWQVAGAPLALLAAGWMLMPAWTADRLLARGPLVRLGSALFAAALLTAGGIWYRIVEIPDAPEPFDVPAFASGIPPLDKGKNDAGLAIRSAWNGVEQMIREAYPPRENRPFLAPVTDNETSISKDLYAALHFGWQDGKPQLEDWLDLHFEKEWYCSVLEAAYCPLGVVEDVRQLTSDDAWGSGRQWRALPFLNVVLTVRGLQRQASGDHWTFVNNLRISLALSRNLQNRAPPRIARAGRDGEMIAVSALDRWLEKVPNHPDLLQSVRDILLEHESQLPEYQDGDKASYLMAQNSLRETPQKLVEEHLRQSAYSEFASVDSSRPDLLKAEISAAALLWRMPWEQERHERILRRIFQGDPQRAWQQQLKEKEWGGYSLTSLRGPGPGPRKKLDLASLRAAQLKAALRLYQARNGANLPKTLDELVPHYLAAVPQDPFDGKPFRYGVLKAEDLVWFNEQRRQDGVGGVRVNPPQTPMRTPIIASKDALNRAGAPVVAAAAVLWKGAPAGQARVWSVGDDEQDDGGLHQGLGIHAGNFNTDLIYLVPLPPH
jgi:hypothetical protein